MSIFQTLAKLHSDFETLADSQHTVPAGVAAAARRGLELRKQFGRGGIGPGQARARQLSTQKTIPSADVKKMFAYFSRHLVDKEGKDWNNKTSPSAGKIAWDLWGGDAGFAWVKQEVKKINSV